MIDCDTDGCNFVAIWTAEFFCTECPNTRDYHFCSRCATNVAEGMCFAMNGCVVDCLPDIRLGILERVADLSDVIKP